MALGQSNRNHIVHNARKIKRMVRNNERKVSIVRKHTREINRTNEFLEVMTASDLNSPERNLPLIDHSYSSCLFLRRYSRITLSKRKRALLDTQGVVIERRGKTQCSEQQTKGLPSPLMSNMAKASFKSATSSSVNFLSAIVMIYVF